MTLITINYNLRFMGEFSSLDIWVNIVGRKYWNVRRVGRGDTVSDSVCANRMKRIFNWLARKGNQNLKIGGLRIFDLIKLDKNWRTLNKKWRGESCSCRSAAGFYTPNKYSFCLLNISLSSIRTEQRRLGFSPRVSINHCLPRTANCLLERIWLLSDRPWSASDTW